MSTPAILANQPTGDVRIAVLGAKAAHPWRCLCLASLLQMTRTTPRRRMILQSLHIRLTDALTFMLALLSPTRLPSAGRKASPRGTNSKYIANSAPTQSRSCRRGYHRAFVGDQHGVLE